MAYELTGSGVDDASVGVAMIDRIDSTIERFTADGAYDTRAIYEVLHPVGEAVPTIVIPPRRTFLSSETQPSRGTPTLEGANGAGTPALTSKRGQKTACTGTSALSVIRFEAGRQRRKRWRQRLGSWSLIE